MIKIDQKVCFSLICFFSQFHTNPVFLKAGNTGTHVPAKFPLVSTKFVIVEGKTVKKEKNPISFSVVLIFICIYILR